MATPLSTDYLAAPIHILQLTDFHLLEDPAGTMMGINTDASFRAVLEVVWQNREPADIVLLTGDLTQDASVEAYRRLRTHLQGISAPIACIPGNHDDMGVMREILAGDAITLDSPISLGDWQIVLLDSTVVDSPGGFLSAEQMEHLEQSLSAHPERMTLVSMHHSPLPTGSEWLDTMLLRNANEFFGILDQHPQVKAVLFGHVHQAMDVWRGSVRFLACPSTCFQFMPQIGNFALDATPPGFRWLLLNADGTLQTGVERLQRLPKGLALASNGYR